MWYRARMSGCLYHWIDSKKSVCPRVELLLQRDHNDLAALSGHHPEKSCNLHGNRCLSIMADREYQNSTFLKIEARLTLPIFVLSRAASTSSSTKNGAGRKLKMKQRWSLPFSPTANTCLFRVRYYFTRKLVNGFKWLFTCEWQRPKRERRWPSLLLTGCPWPWIVSQEPRSYSWCRLGRAHLDSQHLE